MIDAVYLGWGLIALTIVATIICMIVSNRALSFEEGKLKDQNGVLTVEDEEYLDSAYDYVVFLQHFVVTVLVIGAFLLVLGYVFKYH